MVELVPGCWLIDWIVEESLGSGGFAQVHAARHTHDDRRAAIKVVTDAGMADRLRRDPGVLRLEHPNVVRTIAEHLDHDPPFVVLERALGGSLRDELRRGPLSAARVAQITRDLAAGLDHAHARGVLHLDLKPDNVLLHGERALLTDFGASGDVRAEALRQSLPLSELSPGWVGTRDYAAPEVRYGDGAVDRRADVYGLAVLAFELITGRLPLGLDRPSELAPVPPAVDQVFARAMTRDPERRTLSAGAFARELGSALEAGASAPGSSASATQEQRSSLLAYVAFVICLLAVVGVVTWRAQASAPIAALPAELVQVLKASPGPIGILPVVGDEGELGRVCEAASAREELPRVVPVALQPGALSSLWDRAGRAAVVRAHGCETVLFGRRSAPEQPITWFLIDLANWEYRDATPVADPRLNDLARSCREALERHRERRPIAVLPTGDPGLDLRWAAALVNALRGVAPVRASPGLVERLRAEGGDVRRALSVSLAVEATRVDGVLQVRLRDLENGLELYRSAR